MALSLLGRDESVAYYLPLKRNRAAMEYVITNRRIMETVNGMITAQCPLKDALAVAGFSQSEGETRRPLMASMGGVWSLMGPMHETKSRQVGNVVFFHNGRPAVTFYEIPDPKGVVDLVTGMQKSMVTPT